MRTFLKLAKVAALIGIGVLLHRCSTARAGTEVTNSYTLRNPDGTAFTNGATMAVYPPVSQSVVVVGTNIVLGGGFTLGLTNDASGHGVVVCEPNQYRVSYTANNGSTFQFLVNIQATNPLPDFAYEVVGVPVIFVPNSFAAWLTNSLGFMPTPNTYAGVTAALGYVPLTNSPYAITNTLGFNPATNSPAGVYSALGYIPATNTPTGIAYALGFTPAANTMSGITTALGYVPLTNSYQAITNYLTYVPLPNTFYALTNLLAANDAVTTNIAYLAVTTNSGVVTTNIYTLTVTNGILF
jgi:hypothetical protein